MTKAVEGGVGMRPRGRGQLGQGVQAEAYLDFLLVSDPLRGERPQLGDFPVRGESGDVRFAGLSEQRQVAFLHGPRTGVAVKATEVRLNN